ncbi:hypothetical protein V1639_13805 [Pseudarthrobacter sp. J75]|uniref:hypothetical protein n=1 Tax=unclassified Pseudarthrobacter TaxID=2647000 RepID=UPI002E81496A|nr:MULTISPECIES: hypothetical protein [unclassified Pseudarthrobacter]MEE2523705.1 hypothetical protein [Pseudarthrobacter sp. J47]MEE2530096.1 hypothetical protein [Pseudarthrobacter sp. J75]
MSRLRTAVVIAALAALLGTSACGSPETSPETTSQGSSMSTSEYSTLDAAGVDSIRQNLEAKLDMTSGKLVKSQVGLTGESFGPEINTQDTGLISLTIDGPDGRLQAETDRIRFNTTAAREDFSVVTYFLTATSAEDYFALIRDGVKQYGIDADDAERWIASTEADPAKETSYSLTPGTDIGLEVNYDLRYDGGADTQVIIVNVAPLQ